MGGMASERSGRSMGVSHAMGTAKQLAYTAGDEAEVGAWQCDVAVLTQPCGSVG